MSVSGVCVPLGPLNGPVLPTDVIGGLVGVGLAIPLARLIGGAFFGTPGLLGPVVLASLITLALAALLATGIPACRAAYLDPAETLRQD